MAYCRYCGAETNGGNFCPSCGAKIGEELPVEQPTVAPVQPPVQKSMNVLGLLGMIFGISAFVFIWVPFFNLCLAIAAVVLSSVGMAKGDKYRYKGFAIAGLACGIVAIIISLSVIIVVFAETVPNYPYYGVY